MKVADESQIAARPARWLRIALFALLSSLAVLLLLGSTGGFNGSSKAYTTRVTISTIETGLKLYRNRHGVYPTTADGLRMLVRERILDRMPRDGWSNDFLYLSDGTRYEITSYGADAAPGGAGIDADIRSSHP